MKVHETEFETKQVSTVSTQNANQVLPAHGDRIL